MRKILLSLVFLSLTFLVNAQNSSNDALAKHPFDFSLFSSVELKTNKPDYFDDGEVLNVVANPQKGIIDIETDSSDVLVSE